MNIFEFFFQNSQDLCCIANFDGYFEIINPNFEKLLGYSKLELLKNKFTDFIHPDDIASTNAEIEKLKKGDLTINFVNRYRKKDGNYLWFEWSATPNLPEGKMYSIARDISERKRMEEILKDTDERYFDIFDNSFDLIQCLDPLGKFVYVNDTWKKTLGYSDEEIKTKTIFEIIDPERIQFYKDMLTELLNGTQKKNYELVYLAKNGQKIVVNGSSVPKMKDGKMISFRCIFHDITQKKIDQKKLEDYAKELKEREDHIQSIFDNAPDPVIVIDPESKILKWNTKCETVFGWNTSEVVGKPLYDFIIPARYRELHKKGMKHFLETGIGPVLNKPFEIESVNKKGIEFPISLSISPVKKGEGYVFIGFVRDITENKKGVEALKLSESFLNSIIQNIPTMIFVKNAKDLKYAKINKAVEDLFGYSKDEIIGKTDYELFPKDEADRFVNNDKKLLDTGKLLEIEEEPAHTKYKGVRTLETKMVLINDSNEKPIYILAIANDITDRKQAQAELYSKTKELERSNTELEQFAYVASHDLQEPLRMVTSYLQLLEKRYYDQLDQDAKDFISFAVDGSNRMRSLIHSLLEYSRINRVKPFEEIKLNLLLKDVLVNLKASIMESNAIIKINDLPVIYGDPVLINRLFQNLIENAIKFRDTKVPQIEISYKEQNDEYLFSVKDNGIGIQEEYVDKIFVIFKRLHNKEKYPGTGMGLAICKKIVERHGGRIWVESVYGEGSTFYFTIKKGE